MKILIADDDVVSRKMLKMHIEKLGYPVFVATNGQEAWDIWEDEKPKIVVTDWEMPEMDGLELCTKIRESEGKDYTYIIIITARDSRQDLVECMDAGADDYISKPFYKSELFVRIKAGERIIKLQDKIKQGEKLAGVLEMAGAVCHELNQPMQILLTSSFMTMEFPDDEEMDEEIRFVLKQIERMSDITHKLMNITKYETKDYADGMKIIDIDKASDL